MITISKSKFAPDINSVNIKLESYRGVLELKLQLYVNQMLKSTEYCLT